MSKLLIFTILVMFVLPVGIVGSVEPSEIRPITFDEVGNLGLDAENNLYWQGKRVQIRETYELASFERWIASLAALATVVIAIASVLNLKTNN